MSGVIMSGRRRGVVLLAASAAVVVAAVVGFVALRSNGSEGVSTPIVTPTSSPPVASSSPAQTSPAVVVQAAPVMPAAAKKRDRKGAEAFFRYFVDVYNYSFSSLDADAVGRVSADSCKFCAGVKADVDQAVKQDLRYEGARLHVASLVASPGDPTAGLIVVAIVNQDEGRTIAPDGSSEVTVSASEEVRVEAGLRWKDGGWQVFAVTLPGSK